MKRMISWLWLGVLACQACAGGVEEKWLADWRLRWDCGGLQNVFEGISEEELPPWPAIHSAGWPEGGQGWECEGRELSVALVRGLAESEKRMRGGADSDFAAWAHGLLALRDSIVAEEAYVNLLLADAINRCVWVHLGVRLSRTHGVTEDHQTILRELGRFTLSLETLERVVLEELGLNTPPDPLSIGATEQKRLRALWELSSSCGNGRMPMDETGFDAESALRGQALEVLLARLVGSDAFIHTYLPSLVQCLQASEKPARLLDREEIREIAGKETRAPASLGARTLGVVRMASAAADLLEECETGKIWQRLLLMKEDGTRETLSGTPAVFSPCHPAGEERARDAAFSAVGSAMGLDKDSVPVSGAESDPWEGLEDLFWECSELGATEHAGTLREFARTRGKTDAELAERLVEIIRRGAAEGADAVAADQAEGALWHLRWFGGEKEAECVREVMRTTKNGSLRQVAIHVGMQMEPEQWEGWVREVAEDSKFSDFDRFIAYEEAFQVGHEKSAHSRQRVIEVLEEMRQSDPRCINRNRLGAWIAELEGENAWEPWLREVVSGEGFRDADRKRAFRLALQAGRNEGKETRQRVIEVFRELFEDESIEVDRAALRQWIDELEKLP